MPINLTGRELQLLRYLIDHRGKVLSRDELLKEVWEYQPDVSTRTVDVHVRGCGRSWSPIPSSQNIF